MAFMNPFRSLSLLCSVLLSSCMVNHARLYEHAMVCDGVEVPQPRTYLRSGGKCYVQGQRVQLRYVRPGSWVSFGEVIVSPSKWHLSIVPGSRGETVYREVVVTPVTHYEGEDDHPVLYRSGEIEFKEGSTWQAEAPARATQHTAMYGCIGTAGDNSTAFDDDQASRRMTWRGVYALPAAAVALPVDAAATLGSNLVIVPAAGLVSLICLPVTLPQQQAAQTIPPPPPHPKKK